MRYQSLVSPNICCVALACVTSSLARPGQVASMTSVRTLPLVGRAVTGARPRTSVEVTAISSPLTVPETSTDVFGSMFSASSPVRSSVSPAVCRTGT